MSLGVGHITGGVEGEGGEASGLREESAAIVLH